MSFLFKNYSLVKVIHSWNTNNTDRNDLNKQKHTHTYIHIHTHTHTHTHTKHSEKDNTGKG